MTRTAMRLDCTRVPSLPTAAIRSRSVPAPAGSLAAGAFVYLLANVECQQDGNDAVTMRKDGATMHIPSRLPYAPARMPVLEPLVSRRQFTRYAFFSLLGAAAATSAASAARSLYPAKTTGIGARVSAGSVADVKKALKEDRYLKNIAGQFYLLPVETDRVIAVSWVCTDLAFTVHNFDGLFMGCPFCGTRYNAKTGIVEFGIAPRPLNYMPITITGGNVVIDTSQVIERIAFDVIQTTLLK